MTSDTHEEDGFAWVALVDPDRADLDEAMTQFRVHPALREDAAQSGRPPKIEMLDEQLLVLAWDLDPRSAVRYPGELILIVGESWLLSIQRSGDEDVRSLSGVVEADGELDCTTSMRAAVRILAVMIRDYEEAAARIEDELDDVEAEVFDAAVEEDYERIYRLRRRIGHVDRAASAFMRGFESDTEDLSRLVEDDPELRPYLRRAEGDLAALADLLTTQRMALDAVVSSHESNVSSRQNRDMRTIAAVAALLALPTVVAGLYGMNFRDLPLLHVPFGWVVVLAGIIIVDVGAVWWFRRRGWLGESRKRDH
ncbi:CorA family divalent cation transporter [Microbacterium sp. NPDC057659]|uniref:CorA family divalent cation transporter n=1 Tax=Microbacterium sp. NPDC057659 TaxID=3346198 RepID=UPI00367318A3